VTALPTERSDQAGRVVSVVRHRVSTRWLARLAQAALIEVAAITHAVEREGRWHGASQVATAARDHEDRRVLGITV
jgi:hypothetical protein